MTSGGQEGNIFIIYILPKEATLKTKTNSKKTLQLKILIIDKAIHYFSHGDEKEKILKRTPLSHGTISGHQ